MYNNDEIDCTDPELQKKFSRQFNVITRVLFDRLRTEKAQLSPDAIVAPELGAMSAGEWAILWILNQIILKRNRFNRSKKVTAGVVVENTNGDDLSLPPAAQKLQKHTDKNKAVVVPEKNILSKDELTKLLTRNEDGKLHDPHLLVVHVLSAGKDGEEEKKLVHVCLLCQLAYVDLVDYKHHVNEKHVALIAITCSFCNTKFESYVLRNAHFQEAHADILIPKEINDSVVANKE